MIVHNLQQHTEAISFITSKVEMQKIFINLCQKLLFLHQLIHNMTTYCSLNYKFNTWKFKAQNMGRTCCVQKWIFDIWHWSEAFILASTNPQYDDRLFIELRVHFMKIPSLEHVVYINCSECQNKKQFVYTTCSPDVLSL